MPLLWMLRPLRPGTRTSCGWSPRFAGMRPFGFAAWLPPSGKTRCRRSWPAPCCNFCGCWKWARPISFTPDRWLASVSRGFAVDAAWAAASMCATSPPDIVKREGVALESLDHWDESSGHWRDVLVEDRQATPADIAAARIDVSAWLESLPPRSRRLAERLALGESTSDAARQLGVSRSRVSQLRRELHRAWQAFQGESFATL